MCVHQLGPIKAAIGRIPHINQWHNVAEKQLSCDKMFFLLATGKHLHSVDDSSTCQKQNTHLDIVLTTLPVVCKISRIFFAVCANEIIQIF